MSKSVKLKNNIYIDSKSVNHNRTSLENILNDLFFKTNDEETFNISSLSGHITSSTKSIRFSLPTPKNMKNISTITIMSGTICVRSDSGYVANSNTTPISLTSGYTYQIAKGSNNMININVNSTSAFANATNNRTCDIELQNCKIKFS